MNDLYSGIYTFILWATVLGFFIGLVYEVFRTLRHAFYMGTGAFVTKVAYFICDILFFTVAAIIYAIFIFYVNNGRIRGIALLGSLFGFTVYYNTLGRLLCRLSQRIIKAVYRMLAFTGEAVILPILSAIGTVYDIISARRQLRGRIRRFRRKGC